MKCIDLNGPYRMDTLYQEALAACPWLNPQDIEGNKAYAEPREDGLRLWYDERYAPEDAEEQIQAVFAAHDAEAPSAEEMFRVWIVDIARSTAGVALVDLTTVEIKCLLAVLLYKAGGVDLETMTVKPPEEWL